MLMEHFFPQIQVKTKKRPSSKIDHFFPKIQVKTKKKRSSIKNRTLFCTPVQIIGGDADVDLSQTIGGIQPNYWGVYPIGVARGGQGARAPPIKIPLTTKSYDNIT